MFESWSKVTGRLPPGGSTLWLDSGLIGEILRRETFGASGPNYLPNGGVLVTLPPGVGSFEAGTGAQYVVRLIADGTLQHSYPLDEDRVLVLRDGQFYGEQGPWG